MQGEEVECTSVDDLDILQRKTMDIQWQLSFCKPAMI